MKLLSTLAGMGLVLQLSILCLHFCKICFSVRRDAYARDSSELVNAGFLCAHDFWKSPCL